MVKELPIKRGFAKAAMTIVHKFKVTSELATAPHSTPMWVDVPIRMPPPSEIHGHPDISPSWLTGVDPKTTPAVFPPEAAAKGLTSGRGVARCLVAVDGSMTSCAPEAGDPDGPDLRSGRETGLRAEGKPMVGRRRPGRWRTGQGCDPYQSEKQSLGPAPPMSPSFASAACPWMGRSGDAQALAEACLDRILLSCAHELRLALVSKPSVDCEMPCQHNITSEVCA